MLDADTQYSTGDTIMRRTRTDILIYIKSTIYTTFKLNDWREWHPMEVEIPHRVMCGRKKNPNDIQSYVNMMILCRNDDTNSDIF